MRELETETGPEDVRRSPPSLGGWTKQFPIAVTGFLSGQFTAVYAFHHSAPGLGPTASAVFAVVTAVAALGLCVLAARGDGRDA